MHDKPLTEESKSIPIKWRNCTIAQWTKSATMQCCLRTGQPFDIEVKPFHMQSRRISNTIAQQRIMRNILMVVLSTPISCSELLFESHQLPSAVSIWTGCSCLHIHSKHLSPSSSFSLFSFRLLKIWKTQKNKSNWNKSKSITHRNSSKCTEHYLHAVKWYVNWSATKTFG